MNQKGFGLIETMIGAAILVVVIAGSAHLLSSWLGGVRKAVILGEREDLRSFVRKGLDCRNTLRHERARCSATPQNIHGFTDHNQPLLAAISGKVFGTGPNAMTLQITCRDSGLDYELNATVTQNGRSTQLFDVPISCTRCSPASTVASQVTGSTSFPGNQLHHL